MESVQELRSPSGFSVHPGVKQVQATIERLPEKTGRSLEEWIAFVQTEGPPTEKERREWLKTQHKMGTNYAWWIAERAEGKGGEDTDPHAYLQAAEGYVEAMFAGGKAGLRPLYERLLALGQGLGPDVKVCPCKTIVPFYRRHVFAQIKPSTRMRIDFGLSLKGIEAGGRLLDTGGAAAGDRITHRIVITHLDEIDAEVERWLKAAYDLNE